MRKLNKTSKLLRANDKVAIIERLKNDYDGNPKFKVQIIDVSQLPNNNVDYYHNTRLNDEYYTLVSYNIDFDVMMLIKKLEKGSDE